MCSTANLQQMYRIQHSVDKKKQFVPMEAIQFRHSPSFYLKTVQVWLAYIIVFVCVFCTSAYCRNIRLEYDV